MVDTFSRPTFWLEFRLLSDGLQTAAVHTLPLTTWHEVNTPVFRFFPALPTELRLKVWEYLIAPRIVGIACLCLEDGASSVEAQREEIWGPHPAARYSVPVLLHINRETRRLALKHYELSFEWKVPRVLASADMHPPVPVRSPILAAPALPAMQQSSQPPAGSPQPTGESSGPSLPHISSYHDLLDPSPRSSTSGLGNRGENRVESGSMSSETSTATGGNAHPPASAPAPAPELRTSSPPRTWFNFRLDAVYLLGELEPCDSFGFNSPMTYFIPSQTARRVRKTAVSFGALRYGETGHQQIFGALFHVVDRFAPADGEVLVCVTERDEWVHAMMGNDTGLVDERHRHVHARRRRFSLRTDVDADIDADAVATPATPDEGNVVQKIWRDWYRGAIVTSPLRNLRFSLIPENDLEHHVYDFMVATPAKRESNGEVGMAESSKR